jgi:site-specific recombinase XerD
MSTVNPFAPRIVQSVDPRGKDFLTLAEVNRLLDATKHSRNRVRDRAILLTMFRHGLRVSELCGLKRKDLDLNTARLYVRRLKGSVSTEQPVEGDELRAIKRYLATRTDSLPWLFVSERDGQLSRFTVTYMVRTAAAHAGLENVHPHTLRHSCGFYLANKGLDMRLIQDYLGHKSISNTVRYTRTAAVRFEGLWS